MMAQAALALPALHASIPGIMTIRGNTTLVAPLAVALLEANFITDAMLAPRANSSLVEVFTGPDERALSVAALSGWWNGIQYPTKYFDWDLHVQELEDHTHRRDSRPGTTAWFCLTRCHSKDIPRFALARRITDLEATLEGFGQTVLAVLRDAFLHLPDALEPWRAISMAEWLHFKDTSTDEELLENEREDRGYATVQEVLNDADVLTREEFYKNIPYWVTMPKRVLSREAIGAAVRTGLELEVVAACDAIHQFVNSSRFDLRPHQIGAHQFGHDSVDGCAVVLWTEGDQISRVLDDALNMFGESGEYSEFIDAHPIQLTGDEILRNKSRIEQVMQLAALTERLLILVGDPI